MGRLAGFWACCCQACFSYLGAEILGIAANEVERPREAIPKAVRHVSKRLIFYYVGTIFILGLNVYSRDPVLEWFINNPAGNYQGPFVLMAQRANIPGLDHLLNAIALMAALSLANANLYVSVHSFLFCGNKLESDPLRPCDSRPRANYIRSQKRFWSAMDCSHCICCAGWPCVYVIKAYFYKRINHSLRFVTIGIRFPFRHDCNWRSHLLGWYLCHISPFSKSLQGPRGDTRPRSGVTLSTRTCMVRHDMDLNSQYPHFLLVTNF